MNATLRDSTITRPQMPTAEDEARAVHQFTRLQILMEDWDDVVEEWLEEHIGAERAQVWGVPDTSASPLADLSRQLSTPGLYGKRPTWKHANARNLELVGPDGHLERAGFFTRGVFVQYLTLGLGDVFVRFELTRDGRLTQRIVFPHNVYLRAKVDEESCPGELWELRYRHLAPEDKWVFVWEVYDLGERSVTGEEIRAPSHRVHLAKAGEKGQAGGLGEDVSHRFLVPPGEEPGPLVGDAYPYRTADGRPILPFAQYKDADTGQLWNYLSKRGAHRGTLNAALYWSYAGYCARDATGSYTIVGGLVPGSHQVIEAEGGGIHPGQPLKTKIITPGSIEYHRVAEDQTPFVHTVGPGANLTDVADFADRYEMKQAVRWGLNPSDLSRTAANPSSAAALMVSNEGKRDFSEQVEPVFRRVDLTAVQIAAIVLRAGGVATYDEQGYSVVYYRIPRSAAEQRELRERLQWEEERGQRSEIDTYRELHPGTTEDDARAALVRVALERARLDRAISDALAAEGLEPVTPREPNNTDNNPNPGEE